MNHRSARRHQARQLRRHSRRRAHPDTIASFDPTFLASNGIAPNTAEGQAHWARIMPPIITDTTVQTNNESSGTSL
jgi:hypothetical protein